MPATPLTPKQLATPHRPVTGARTRLGSTTRLERSFFDPYRAEERSQWWACGAAAAALADPVRGPSLLAAFIERFSHRQSYGDALKLWSEPDRRDWSRLWSGYTAACASRDETPDPELLSRAWGMAALHHPAEADRLVAQEGADPHGLMLAPLRSWPQSAWAMVLDRVCEADRERLDTERSKPSSGVLRTVAFLEHHWDGKWEHTERESALRSLHALTWRSQGSHDSATTWGRRFRDRLLAEGASPSREVNPTAALWDSPLGSWWRSIGSDDGTYGRADGAERRVSQEWGEALLSAVAEPVPCQWGALASLPEPERLMRLLIEKNSTPWSGTTFHRPLFEENRRPMQRTPERGTAEADLRIATGMKIPFETWMGISLNRPLSSFANWLESWQAASPQPDEPERAWRRQSFAAWLDILAAARLEERGGREKAAEAWLRVGRTWRTVLGQDWVPALRAVGAELAAKLPGAALAAVLATSTSAELSALFEGTRAVHAEAPQPHRLKEVRASSWASRHTFPARAFGHLLADARCMPQALAFLQSKDGAAWKDAGWAALVCAPPALIRAEAGGFWVENLGRPSKEEWSTLLGRALVGNPALAAVLVQDAVRPQVLTPAEARTLASAWIAALTSDPAYRVSTRKEEAAFDQDADWTARHAVLRQLHAWGGLAANSPGAELLNSLTEKLWKDRPENLSGYPASGVSAVEAMVEMGVWDEVARNATDPRLALLSAHANRLCLDREMPVQAARQPRFRL